MVHEVAVAPKPIVGAAYVQAILNHHTTPEEAGTVFSRTKPRLAVFSHIVKLADPNNPAPADDEITERARTTWAGGLAVGKELERFIVTAEGVERVRL